MFFFVELTRECMLGGCIMGGGHIYRKGDHDAAITQYIETIEHVEPSYVIRNFLDAQRIHNLTRYLQALHAKKRATPDHTTLLLNCYTKLKDVGKLNDFIKVGDGCVVGALYFLSGVCFRLFFVLMLVLYI
jgi:hypothetical protein